MELRKRGTGSQPRLRNSRAFRFPLSTFIFPPRFSNLAGQLRCSRRTDRAQTPSSHRDNRSGSAAARERCDPHVHAAKRYRRSSPSEKNSSNRGLSRFRPAGGDDDGSSRTVVSDSHNPAGDGRQLFREESYPRDQLARFQRFVSARGLDGVVHSPHTRIREKRISGFESRRCACLPSARSHPGSSCGSGAQRHPSYLDSSTTDNRRPHPQSIFRQLLRTTSTARKPRRNYNLPRLRRHLERLVEFPN